jgi:hypothetical protein
MIGKPIYKAPRRYIRVGNAEYLKRGALSIGDQFLIVSGAPCLMGHWNKTIEVEDVWTEYAFDRELGGVNGVGRMHNDRYQKAQYKNLTTGVTGSCYSWQLEDAQISGYSRFIYVASGDVVFSGSAQSLKT